MAFRLFFHFNRERGAAKALINTLPITSRRFSLEKNADVETSDVRSVDFSDPCDLSGKQGAADFRNQKRVPSGLQDSLAVTGTRFPQ